MKLKEGKLFETKYELIDHEKIENKFIEERIKFNLDIEKNQKKKKSENEKILKEKIDTKFKFKTLLRQFNYKPMIFKFRIVFQIFIILLLALSLINFILVKNKKQKIKKDLLIYQNTIKKLNNFLYIVKNLEEFILKYSYFQTKEDNLEKIAINFKQRNIKRITKINKVRKIINDNGYNKYFNKKKVKVFFKNKENELHSILELEEIFIGKIIEYNILIDQKKLDIIGGYNDLNYFFINNTLNPFFKVNLQILKEIENDLTRKIDEIHFLTILANVTKFILLFSFLLIFIIVYLKILKINISLLQGFLKIPENFFNKKFDNIQKYSNSIKDNNKTDEDTATLTLTFNNQIKLNKNICHRKKSFKNEKKFFNFKLIFFMFFIILIIGFDISYSVFLFKTRIEEKKNFIKNNILFLNSENGILNDYLILTNEILNLKIPIKYKKTEILSKELFSNLSNLINNFFFTLIKNQTDIKYTTKIEKSFFLAVCNNEEVYINEEEKNICKKDFGKYFGVIFMLADYLGKMINLQNKLDLNLFFIEEYKSLEEICFLKSL